MVLALIISLLAAFATASSTSDSLAECSDVSSHPEFDYVVIGAGVGGGPIATRLVEAGFSVLLVDAGHGVFNVNTTIPRYFFSAFQDPQTELNYTLNDYPPGFKIQKNDVWYPRARGLGGSATHNAMVNVIASHGTVLDAMADTLNDPTWSRAHMQKYFKRIENNVYLPQRDSEHGFNGWLKTNLNPFRVLASPKYFDKQFQDILHALRGSDKPLDDLNTVANDAAVGVNPSSLTYDQFYNRSSVFERIVQVHSESLGRLQLAEDTLATKIRLCADDGGKPKAYAVDIAPGAALPVGINFEGKQELKIKTIKVKYEVILSAGVFQTPQILMLSGIGDKAQLTKHGIKTVVHLPGVGKNLQDHDEISTIWSLKKNYTDTAGCILGSTVEQDPCLKEWVESGHQHPYSFNTLYSATLSKSSPTLASSDLFTYWLRGYFPGFLRQQPQMVLDNDNFLTAVVLKGQTHSRGTVTLTGSHPQDEVLIEKNRFQTPGSNEDITGMRVGIKRVYEIASLPGIAEHIDAVVFPNPPAVTDKEIDEHILHNVFGHHACCTAAIGVDEDAVLDGDFKVRGVSALRVVDISSWPEAPGFFVTTSTYMLSEKAADVVIAASKANSQSTTLNYSDEAQVVLSSQGYGEL